MICYDYRLAYVAEIPNLLKQGWEPVPHVPIVSSYAMAQPSEYVFLRKKKIS